MHAPRYDVEYNFPMGFSELEGIHNRSDFDLTQHAKFSGKNLEYFDEAQKKNLFPM
jgi:glycyl-tRNA synthetase